jgi:Flp pilus assembly protein TadG
VNRQRGHAFGKVGARARGRGQALVELTLVLPLLLLMLMGVVDVGRIVFTYLALEDAVQEGALYASYEPAQASAIVARVRSSSNHAEVVGATVPVPVCATTPAPGTVSVTATYDLPLLTPVGSQLFGGSIHLSATFIATNFKGSCT